jgi:hypothetical protein
MKRTHILPLALLAASLVPACAEQAMVAPSTAAAAASAAPAGATSEDLGSPEGALAAVDHAEQAIDRLLAPAPVSTTIAQSAGQAAPIQPRVQVQTAAPPPPPPTSPPAPPPPEKSAEEKASHDGAASGAKPQAPSERSAGAKKAGPRDRESLRPESTFADSCSTACGALASMERAAEHLCGMTSAVDGRCTSARARVKSASARVRAACPSCS